MRNSAVLNTEILQCSWYIRFFSRSFYMQLLQSKVIKLQSCLFGVCTPTEVSRRLLTWFANLLFLLSNRRDWSQLSQRHCCQQCFNALSIFRAGYELIELNCFLAHVSCKSPGLIVVFEVPVHSLISVILLLSHVLEIISFGFLTSISKQL